MLTIYNNSGRILGEGFLVLVFYFLKCGAAKSKGIKSIKSGLV